MYLTVICCPTELQLYFTVQLGLEAFLTKTESDFLEIISLTWPVLDL